MSKAHQVVRVSVFKWCLSRTYRYLWRRCAVRIHSCFINDSAGETSPGEGALIGLSTVTVPGLIVTPLFCPTCTGVVALTNRSHTGHAPVADLNRIPIKYFMLLRAYRKVPVDQL